MPWLLDLRPARCVAAVVLPFVLLGGCFKSLDESLLDQKDGGNSGNGGSSGDGGPGGTGGAGDSGADAQVVIPYDAAKYPVSNLALGTPPVIITADDSNVFRTTQNMADATLVAQPIAATSGTQLPNPLERPQAMTTPPSSTWVYVAGGSNLTPAGSLVRVAKIGGAVEPISTGAINIELAVGISAGNDGFGYVSLKGVAAGTPLLMRFPLANTAPATALFTSEDPNESGGDVAAEANCAYWISNGTIWVTSASGGDRKPATQSAVTDAIGLTTDSTSFYFTRGGDGSVWKRELSAGSCDGSGAAETMLAAGFPGIGDVVRYDQSVAWVAKGEGPEYTGGGVFTMLAAGGEITQIAPHDQGPVDIDQGLSEIVFSTSEGGVRKVPKQPE
jgi:hypothetical protein